MSDWDDKMYSDWFAAKASQMASQMKPIAINQGDVVKVQFLLDPEAGQYLANYNLAAEATYVQYAGMPSLKCTVPACPLCSYVSPAKEPPTHQPDAVLREEIPALSEKVLCPCPSCRAGSRQPSAISNIIIHLNDRAGWTREQIADWLDTLDQDLSFTLPEIPEITEGESR